MTCQCLYSISLVTIFLKTRKLEKKMGTRRAQAMPIPSVVIALQVMFSVLFDDLFNNVHSCRNAMALL